MSLQAIATLLGHTPPGLPAVAETMADRDPDDFFDAKITRSDVPDNTTSP